jgi:hypothetical protein
MLYYVCVGNSANLNNGEIKMFRSKIKVYWVEIALYTQAIAAGIAYVIWG